MKSPEVYFIIGAGRSGTTLLSNLLNAHPAVICPPENDFLLNLIYHFNKKNYTEKTSEALLNALWIRKREFEELWNLPYPKLLDALQKCNDLQQAYVAILSHYDLQKKANIVIDKNPFYSVHVPLLMHTFPKAKFIVMVRDYRDRYISLKNQEGEIIKNAMMRNMAWGTFYNEIDISSSKHPEAFHYLTYEHLVSNPTQTLSKLCNFIGVSFDEQMLQFHNKKRMVVSEKSVIQESMNQMHQQSNEPISTSKSGHWRELLSSEELKEITYFNGETAKKMGYKDIPELSEMDKTHIQKKYKGAVQKARLLFWLKRQSYKLPLWIQRILTSGYRKKLAKK